MEDDDDVPSTPTFSTITALEGTPEPSVVPMTSESDKPLTRTGKRRGWAGYDVDPLEEEERAAKKQRIDAEWQVNNLPTAGSKRRTRVKHNPRAALQVKTRATKVTIFPIPASAETTTTAQANRPTQEATSSNISTPAKNYVAANTDATTSQITSIPPTIIQGVPLSTPSPTLKSIPVRVTYSLTSDSTPEVATIQQPTSHAAAPFRASKSAIVETEQIMTAVQLPYFGALTAHTSDVGDFHATMEPETSTSGSPNAAIEQFPAVHMDGSNGSQADDELSVDESGSSSMLGRDRATLHVSKPRLKNLVSGTMRTCSAVSLVFNTHGHKLTMEIVRPTAASRGNSACYDPGASRTEETFYDDEVPRKGPSLRSRRKEKKYRSSVNRGSEEQGEDKREGEILRGLSELYVY